MATSSFFVPFQMHMAEADTTLAAKLQRLMPTQVQEFAAILLDSQGVIVAWLSGAERIFGYTAEEIEGKPVARLFCPEDVESDVPRFERQVAIAEGRAEDDRWMLRKDGLRFWAAGTLSPLRDDQGKLCGFAKILRNRTDIKSQIESLEKRIASLTRAEANKNEFIATLAHELRGPLSSLVNATEILRCAAPSTEETEFASATIQRQIEAMRRLIDDLLDVTRIRVGKVILKKERLSLGEVLRNAIETCRPLIDRRTHEVKLLLTDSPAIVEADPVRLEQVFVNLIQNAANYTDYGGNIYVKLFVEGEEAVVKVEDTGIGISADTLPRIFDLFTQAEFTSEKSGLGIGLAVVKDLVTLHDGTVQVRSDGIGKGSEFVVRLPLVIPDQACDSHTPHP